VDTERADLNVRRGGRLLAGALVAFHGDSLLCIDVDGSFSCPFFLIDDTDRQPLVFD
jgi:hypothetical protein